MSAPAFINSALVRAPERFVRRGGRWKAIDIPVRYGLWPSTRLGPVLIDTGYGACIFEAACNSPLLRLYNAALRIRLLAENGLAQTLRRQGYRLDDVEIVIVTHFHADHISELKLLPRARLIGSGMAYQALMKMSRHQQLRHGFFAELLPVDFESRFLPVENFRQIEAPRGLGMAYDIMENGTCLAVPLPGHAIGHFGLVWPERDPPLLYAVDTTWVTEALEEDFMPGFPAVLVNEDKVSVLESANKVRAFKSLGGNVILTHDPNLTSWDAD